MANHLYKSKTGEQQKYTPVDLLQSSIISIPKDLKASLCNSNNYRGISLFNAICKVFDYVIIYLCSKF